MLVICTFVSGAALVLCIYTLGLRAENQRLRACQTRLWRDAVEANRSDNPDRSKPQRKV